VVGHIVAVVFALTAVVGSAYADMGGIYSSEAEVSEEGQKAIILHNLDEEVLILGTDLRTDKDTYVLRFIPFPSEPQVGLAPPDVFKSAAELMKKHRLRFFYQTKGSSSSTNGVELRFYKKLAAHDLTVVKVDDISCFRQWVNSFFRDKRLPTKKSYPDVEGIVGDYLKRGINYFAFDFVRTTDETRLVDPVMYRFMSKELYYPLKTSSTFGGKGFIDMILITPRTLCVPDDIFVSSCFGLKGFHPSSSAQVSKLELEDIYPDAQRFFGDREVYIQLVKYRGDYDFQSDVFADPSKGAEQALDIPEYGPRGSPFGEFAQALKASTVSNAVPKVVDGNNEFAFELYKTISAMNEGENQNIFLSPFSISAALAMTYAGARGNTQIQMGRVLRFNILQEELHLTLSSLLRTLKEPPDDSYQLYIANSLWGQRGYGFKKEFLDLIARYYAGGFNEVDFKGETEKSRKMINKWTQNNTADKIKDILGPKDIDYLTRLVLTNAIYFKGTWAWQFEKELTRSASFYVTPEKKVDVQMMFQEGKFPYTEPDQQLQMVELPYAGHALSMVILLPRGALLNLEGALTRENFDNWLSMIGEKEVGLFVPRFKFEWRYYLKKALVSMGMVDAFSRVKADFSGMDGTRRLYAEKVIRGANIDVNEEGTEATAATAVVMDVKSIGPKPIMPSSS